MNGANRQTQKCPLVVFLRMAGRMVDGPAVPVLTSSKRGCVKVAGPAILNSFDRRVVMISFFIIFTLYLKLEPPVRHLWFVRAPQ